MVSIGLLETVLGYIRKARNRDIIEFKDFLLGIEEYLADDYHDLKAFENFLFSYPDYFITKDKRIKVHCKSDNRDYYYRVEDGKTITDGEEPPLVRYSDEKREKYLKEMGMNCEENKEAVNHPAHYTQGDIECIDAIKAATVGKTGIEAACVGNVIKYLWRYESKNGVEDCRKAKWYLERLIKEVSAREKEEVDGKE